MRNKYGAKKTKADDGRVYDSKLEAKRAFELQLMQRAGEIAGLDYQVPYKLIVNGDLICTYKADFTYWQGDKFIVEDCKGVITKDFRIKAKLFKALQGFDITIYPPKRRKKNAKKTIKKASK